MKDAIEISTVDAFQGKDSGVVFVDTVIAKENLSHQPTIENDAEDENDNGSGDYIRTGAVTGFVRDPKRLYVALTRGKDETIVVCQGTLLVSTLGGVRGKQYNALANMTADS